VLKSGLASVLSGDDASTCLSLINDVRRTAGSCAANLCLHLPPTVLGDLSVLAGAACSLIQSLEYAWVQLPECGDTCATSVSDVRWVAGEMEALSSLLWHATRHSGRLTKTQLQLVCALGRGPLKSMEVKVNVAGMLGVLGKSPEHFPHNFVIASTLLTMLDTSLSSTSSSSSSSEVGSTLEVVAEVANSLIDIYTEDNTHTQQIKQLSLLPKLSAALPRVAQRVRSQGRTLDPMLGERLEETVENLGAFVDYKKDHI